VKALDLLKKFTTEIDQRIEKILGNTPIREEFHPKTFKPYAARR